MWKPVRLQGSGAATIINAVKRPDGEAGQPGAQKVKGLIDSRDRRPAPRPARAGIRPRRGGPLRDRAGRGHHGAREERRLFPDVLHRRASTASRSPAPTAAAGSSSTAMPTISQIANNHVTGNSGVLHGGIRVGHPSLAAGRRRALRLQPQPEHPPQRDHAERRPERLRAPAAACRCARAPTTTPSPATSSAATSTWATAAGSGTSA